MRWRKQAWFVNVCLLVVCFARMPAWFVLVVGLSWACLVFFFFFFFLFLFFFGVATGCD